MNSSAVALLPNDLLSEILRLATGFDTTCKFLVSQVSAHWRRVALNSPLLWSNIRLSTRRDCYRLPLVLERCGTSALLYIVVSSPFLRPAEAADLEVAMRALEPYAPRIRTLNMSAPTDALLNANLDFPELYTLRARAAITSDRLETRIRLKAPALRVLDLSWVSSVGIVDLLTPDLEEICLDSCLGLQLDDVLVALTRCVDIVHLTIRSEEIEDIAPETRWEIPQLRHLDTLELHLPFPLLVKVLEHSEHGDIPAMSISIPFGGASEAMSIYTLLLRDVGPGIADYAWADAQSLRVTDDAGRVRALSVRNDLSSGDHGLIPLWPHISDAWRARSVTMPLQLWDVHAVADMADSARYPQPAPAAATRLRVLVSRGNVEEMCREELSAHGGTLRARLTMRFPRLKRVELGAAQTPPTAALPARFVLHILRGIICYSSQHIEVEIDARIAEVQQTRDLLESEGSARWRLLN